MNTLIVTWHPEPASFNGALVTTARQALEAAGHTVVVSDLRASAFDPVSDRRNFSTVKDGAYFKQQIEELHASEVGGFAPEVEEQIARVEACDLMIWQFPLWWFGLPAVLKGWVDRVFAMGRTYGGGRFYETGVFGGKRALLSLTTGGGPEAYEPDGFNGDLAGILRPIHRGMLQFTGFEVLAPHVVFGPAHLSDEQRAQALADWAARLPGLAHEPPLDVGRF